MASALDQRPSAPASAASGPSAGAPAIGKRPLVGSAPTTSVAAPASEGVAPRSTAGSGVTMQQLFGRPAAPPQPGAPANAADREDARVAGSASARQLGQRGHAMQYFRLHQPAFLEAARAQLVAANLPTGSPRLAWAAGAARFAQQLGYVLLGPEAGELPELLYPIDPWELIDAHREMDADPTLATGAMRWAPAAGLALAGAFERGVRSALPRVAGRYVAAQGAQDPRELVASHPMDRVVAAALCATGVVTLLPGRAAPDAEVQTRGVRLVTRYRWLGDRDPALWNWLAVEEPADATLEDIAATLWNRTDYAYGLTRIAGYVAVPRAWAREVPGVQARGEALSMERFERTPAEQLAESTLGDAAALASHPVTKGPVASPARAVVLDQLESTALILDDLAAQLTPWQVASPLASGRAFVARQRLALPGAEPQALAQWAPVIADQRAIVGDAAAGTLQVLAQLATAGVTAAADRRNPGVQVLLGYARAAGTAQLGETARQRLAEARAAHAMLPVQLIARASQDAGRELGALSRGAAGDPVATARSRELTADQATVAGEVAMLQSQSLGAGAPDPELLETAGLDAETLGFRAQLASLCSGLKALANALDAADEGVVAELANLSARSGMILTRSHLDTARYWLETVESRLDHAQPAAIHAHYDALPASEDREKMRAFALRQTRRGQLQVAREELAAIVKRHGLSAALFKEAEQELHSAQLRALVAHIAALLAAGVLSGGLATMAGEAAAGMVAGSRAVTSVGEAASLARSARLVGAVTSAVVDAGANAAAQTALTGDSVGASFAENLVTNAAVRAVLHPLHAVVRTWGGLDDESLALWTKQGATGKLALAKTAMVTAELITAAATSYVVHRLVTVARGQQPDEQTVATWAAQGATLVLARVIHGRLTETMARLRSAGAHAGELTARVTRQLADSAKLAAAEHAEPGSALRLLAEHRRLLEDEIAFWRAVAGDAHARRAIGVDEAQASTRLASAEISADELAGRAMRYLPLQLAGLEQEVEGGRRWAGGTEQIAEALNNARKAGVALTVEPPGAALPAARIWRVRLGDEALEIRERARTGRVRAAAEHVSPDTVATAQRYAGAARDLRILAEERIAAEVDAGTDFVTETLQIGHGFGGVMNQDTQHEHGAVGDPHNHLIVYEHDGAMTGRGALASGQPRDQQTMPGVRTREHTTDATGYTRSADLGAATEVGRLEMQTPAYRARVTAYQERGLADGTPWTHPDKAVRIRVEKDGKSRWIYANRCDNVGGMGPTHFGPARKIIGEAGADDDMFKAMRAAGVLLGGDEPDISSRFKPGDRVLVWGGSPTGAWAGEDASQHGARADVVSERPEVHRTPETPATVVTAAELEAQLRDAAAAGDSARVQALLEQRIQETHSGAGLARNRVPGATYGPGARQRNIHVELGVPGRMRLLPSGKVEVAITVGQAAAGVGDQPTVRVYDRVVIALGQDPGDAGGPAGLLGKGAPLQRQPRGAVDTRTPVPDGTVALHMIRDADGRLVGLESESGRLRLLGAAGATEKLAPWVVASERAEFTAKVRAVSAAGERTHTGDTISADSARVTTGIEAQRDRLPVAREVIGARDFELPASVPADRLALPPDQPGVWATRLEAYLTSALRGRPGRVKVALVASGRDGVHAFRVTNGGEDVGTLRVYDRMEVAQLEAQLRAQVARKVPTLEPEAERGTMSVAGGATAQLTSHAREPAPNLKRGASLSGMVDEWAAMPERTPGQIEAKSDVFRDRIQAAVKRAAQTLAELHNQFADGSFMSVAAKQRAIQDVYARLSSPAVVRALGADGIARTRARLKPLEAAFMAAKLPATVELGDASASAFEFKDHKLDPSSPKHEMMFGRLSAADVGGMRQSIDSKTQKGTGTGAADVAQFLESLQRDPRLTSKAADLERLFRREYTDTLTTARAPAADRRSAVNWYRTADVLAAVARGDAGAVSRLRTLLVEESP